MKPIIEKPKGIIYRKKNIIASDDQGTPIQDDEGRSICNCANPNPTKWPDDKFRCLECFGIWFH